MNISCPLPGDKFDETAGKIVLMKNVTILIGIHRTYFRNVNFITNKINSRNFNTNSYNIGKIS